MTRNGKVVILCKKDDAVILNLQLEVLAVFKQKGGFYVADTKIRNPKYKLPFGGPAR